MKGFFRPNEWSMTLDDFRRLWPELAAYDEERSEAIGPMIEMLFRSTVEYLQGSAKGALDVTDYCRMGSQGGGGKPYVHYEMESIVVDGFIVFLIHHNFDQTISDFPPRTARFAAIQCNVSHDSYERGKGKVVAQKVWDVCLKYWGSTPLEALKKSTAEHLKAFPADHTSDRKQLYNL